MQADTQKYSNSTVFIVIAFLAMFIIMPPLCRVFYKEEEVVEDTPAQEVALTNGTLTCTKTYATMGTEVSSTATYKDGSIVNNVIVIKNPLLSEAGLTEEGQTEFAEYAGMFSSLLTVPETNRVIDGTTITVTLDESLVDSVEDSSQISNQLQDALSLQNSYEVNGYSCSTSE